MTSNQVVSTMFDVKTFVITWIDSYHCRFSLKTLGSHVLSRLWWSLYWVILHGSTFVLVVAVLSSHHGSTLVSSSHDCVQSVITTMDLQCIGRQPCCTLYEIFSSKSVVLQQFPLSDKSIAISSIKALHLSIFNNFMLWGAFCYTQNLPIMRFSVYTPGDVLIE